MNKFFVSVCYIGLLPFAPGTFGSLAGVVLGLTIEFWLGFPALLIAAVTLFLFGWIGTQNYISKNKKKHDPQEIVIDEVVGQLVSFLPISFYIWYNNSDELNSGFYNWLLAFLLFRLFDIYKPWPVSWADKLTSSLGVMLDDLLAGFCSALFIFGFILIFS